MTAHNNGTDRTGLLYFLVDHNEFSDLSFKILDVSESGEDEFILFSPIKKPNWDDFYNRNNSHNGAGYNHAYEGWDKQETAVAKFTAKFLSSLDEVALGAIGPPDSRIIMPLRDMFHALDSRFGFITSGELRKERTKLRIPIQSLSKFDQLLETHASVHLLLEDNDVPTCENEKIFTLQDALVNFPQLEIPTNNFEREHKIKSKGRTFDRYTSELIDYINNNGLQDAAPKNQPHAYAANVKRDRDDGDDSPSTQPSSSPAFDNTEERLAKIEKMLNAAVKGKNNPKKPTGDGKRSKKDPKVGLDSPSEYCFTHGFGNHKGVNCRNFEGSENQRMATADNTMGGSAKVWKIRK